MGKLWVSGKGMFEEYSDDLFEGLLKVEFPFPVIKEDVIEVTEEDLSEKLSLKFERMPLSLFQQQLEFLKWCNQEKKSEGFVAMRYIDGKWENVVFPQWCTATSVCYHPELLLDKATRIVGDTHAHPVSKDKHGGSFHSHTDALDERKNNGIFIVVTGWTPMTCDPDIVGCVRGKRFHLKPESLFDLTQYDPNPTFPEEWKAMVGSTPCKGCDRKREVERLGKEVSEKKIAYEDDKKFRLVPKAVLEVWRTEVAKDKETLGKKVAAVIKDVRSRMTGANWLKLIRCDNYGCHKLCTSVYCNECNKSILIDKVIDGFVDILDEHDALLSNPQELSLIREIVEEDMKPKELPPVQIGPTPAATTTGPGGSGTPHPSPTNSATTTASTVAKEEKGHILMVHTGKACTVDCVYKEFPHEHVRTGEMLEKVFGTIVEGRPREHCAGVNKTCLYPETATCDNGCVLSRTGIIPPDKVDSDHLLPKCESSTCIQNNHTWYSCEIKKTLDTAAKMCPGKQCEQGGHSWNTCEYKILMVRLIASGRVKPPSVSAKKDDETKRFEKCTDEGCKATAHSRLNCPERGDKDSCTEKTCQDNDHRFRIKCPVYIRRAESGACTMKMCQDSDHVNPPTNYDCPIAKQRKAANYASAPPAPYSYPSTPTDPITIVGNDANCPGVSCSYHGKHHQHRLSTDAGTPAPAAADDAAAWGHDMGC